METIQLKTHIGSDGVLKVETPTRFKDVDAEIVIVVQTSAAQPVDHLGWPINYFDAIDAIEADDLTERPDQGVLEEREPLE